MKEKILEKVTSDITEEKPTLIKRFYLWVRENWLALTCALIISIITIVVIPIVYSIKKNVASSGNTTLSWNTAGMTIINQQTPINGMNNSIGLISAIKIDSGSNIYLVDQSKHRVLMYQSAQSNLILYAGYLNGTNGSDLMSLNTPNDIYVVSTNLIYIVDSWNHRILSWASSSSQGTSIYGTGQAGSDLSQLNNPMSITMDGNSNLYIADYGNNRIIQLNLANNQATLYIPYNTAGDRSTYVYTPISIRYHSPTNSLVIAQQMGYNVVRWVLGSSNWQLICGSASSDLSGTSRTLFQRVFSAENDALANTYVVDSDNQRVQFFQGDGTKGRTIAGVIGAVGNNSYIFNQPTAITLDILNNFYVADSNNFRIQMFQRS